MRERKRAHQIYFKIDWSSCEQNRNAVASCCLCDCKSKRNTIPLNKTESMLWGVISMWPSYRSKNTACATMTMDKHCFATVSNYRKTKFIYTFELVSDMINKFLNVDYCEGCAVGHAHRKTKSLRKTSWNDSLFSFCFHMLSGILCYAHR